MNSTFVTATAKLQHRLAVQRQLVGTLSRRLSDLVASRGLCWVPRYSFPERDERESHLLIGHVSPKRESNVPISQQLQWLQADLTAVADIGESMQRDYADTIGKIRDLEDFCRLLGDDTSPPRESAINSAPHVTTLILDEVHEHHNRLSERIVFNDLSLLVGEKRQGPGRKTRRVVSTAQRFGIPGG